MCKFTYKNTNNTLQITLTITAYHCNIHRPTQTGFFYILLYTDSLISSLKYKKYRTGLDHVSRVNMEEKDVLHAWNRLRWFSTGASASYKNIDELELCFKMIATMKVSVMLCSVSKTKHTTCTEKLSFLFLPMH